MISSSRAALNDTSTREDTHNKIAQTIGEIYMISSSRAALNATKSPKLLERCIWFHQVVLLWMQQNRPNYWRDVYDFIKSCCFEWYEHSWRHAQQNRPNYWRDIYDFIKSCCFECNKIAQTIGEIYMISSSRAALNATKSPKLLERCIWFHQVVLLWMIRALVKTRTTKSPKLLERCIWFHQVVLLWMQQNRPNYWRDVYDFIKSCCFEWYEHSWRHAQQNRPNYWRDVYDFIKSCCFECNKIAQTIGEIYMISSSRAALNDTSTREDTHNKIAQTIGEMYMISSSRAALNATKSPKLLERCIWFHQVVLLWMQQNRPNYWRDIYDFIKSCCFECNKIAQTIGEIYMISSSRAALNATKSPKLLERCIWFHQVVLLWMQQNRPNYWRDIYDFIKSCCFECNKIAQTIGEMYMISSSRAALNATKSPKLLERCIWFHQVVLLWMQQNRPNYWRDVYDFIKSCCFECNKIAQTIGEIYMISSSRAALNATKSPKLLERCIWFHQVVLLWMQQNRPNYWRDVYDFIKSCCFECNKIAQTIGEIYMISSSRAALNATKSPKLLERCIWFHQVVLLWMQQNRPNYWRDVYDFIKSCCFECNKIAQTIGEMYMISSSRAALNATKSPKLLERCIWFHQVVLLWMQQNRPNYWRDVYDFIKSCCFECNKIAQTIGEMYMISSSRAALNATKSPKLLERYIWFHQVVLLWMQQNRPNYWRDIYDFIKSCCFECNKIAQTIGEIYMISSSRAALNATKSPKLLERYIWFHQVVLLWMQQNRPNYWRDVYDFIKSCCFEWYEHSWRHAQQNRPNYWRDIYDFIKSCCFECNKIAQTIGEIYMISSSRAALNDTSTREDTHNKIAQTIGEIYMISSSRAALNATKSPKLLERCIWFHQVVLLWIPFLSSGVTRTDAQRSVHCAIMSCLLPSGFHTVYASHEKHRKLAMFHEHLDDLYFVRILLQSVCVIVLNFYWLEIRNVNVNYSCSDP